MRIAGRRVEENVLLGQILGQIKEISLAALTLEASAILEQTAGFGHAGANDPLIIRFIIYKLLLPHLHHLIDSHVLLELQLARLVIHKSLVLSVLELSLMTCLRATNPLQLLDGVGGYVLRPLLLLLLSLLVLLLHPLMGEETLFEPLRTVAFDLGIAELLLQ